MLYESHAPALSSKLDLVLGTNGNNLLACSFVLKLLSGDLNQAFLTWLFSKLEICPSWASSHTGRNCRKGLNSRLCLLWRGYLLSLQLASAQAAPSLYKTDKTTSTS